MTTLLLLATLAHADPGFYDPEAVTAESALFQEAGEQAGAAYDERSRRAAAMATGLRQLETSLDLLGPRAPAERYDRLDELRTRYQREHAVLQAFLATLSEDFEQQFEEALERALAAQEGDVTPCQREIATSKPLPGMPVRTEPNPECTGDDRTDAIAAALDADEDLKAALAEIQGLQWPDITLPGQPQPVLGEGERHVDVLTLVDRVASERLKAIDRQDDEARLPFQAALEQGADKAELEGLLTQAREITAATAARRAALGGSVIEAADLVLAKWRRKGEPATGWCANPAVLGGCVGTSATDELVPRLASEKKVQKAAG